jgi:DeoR/GlpR family transcriptional regulator of sugar metabolism
MPEPESSSRQDQLDLADRRREFIIRSVQTNGILTDKEIRDEAERSGLNWSSSPQSLKEDADYFRQHHHAIERPKRAGRFVAGRTNFRSTFDVRLDEAKSAKLAIGRFGASLIVGMNTIRNADGSTAPGLLSTEDEVLSQLKEQCPNKPQSNAAFHRLEDKLSSYFSQSNRTVAIDAGTTTMHVIETLTDDNLVHIPHPDSRLHSLHVLTNCPHISRRLEDPASNIEVIMLGGRLRKQTAAAAGYLCELFLEAWNPRLHMCLLGTTSLCNYRRRQGTRDNLQLLGFHSDSAEESATKSAILQRSAIRVVLMDSRKLAPERASVYPFAAIGGEHVDLVVTDNDLRTENRKHYDDCMQALWRSGTAVIALDNSKSKSE